MTDKQSNLPDDYNAPEASKKAAGKRKFSSIWIVPIIALLIGLFLVFRLVTEAGPTITISFKEGTGLEVGKTKVKYRNIEVGEVSSIDLKKDLSGVIVSVEMEPSAKSYLREKTRFWVVKPSVSGGNVTGLSTLLSGSYIGIEPAIEGQPKKNFTGLERQPIIKSADDGGRYKLRADSLGSLDFGSPVYYKGIQVGQIVDYVLKDGDIIFDVFIEKPYDGKVNAGTRFWNVSGFDVTLSADGLKINTESLVSIISGGLSFDTPRSFDVDNQIAVNADTEFRLYATKDASRQRQFKETRKLLLYFDDPVRGLVPGATVELRGFKIGEVTDIRLELNRETGEFRIPVLIEVEPERAFVTQGKDFDFEAAVQKLVDKGLRARLKTGNLLTGRLFVDFEFYPDAPAATADFSEKYPVLPTMRGTLGVITEDARILVDELRQVGQKINSLLDSEEFRISMANLSETLQNVKQISAQLDQDAAPKITAILTDAEATLADAQELFASNSTTRTEINRILVELAEAAQSIRLLADYLEQNPEALIKGKD